MREIGISPRFSRDKFVPLQTKQRYSTRDISSEVFLTLFFRGFVPFLSLADFVSRDKNLQVTDLQRLKSCFEELVTATTSNRQKGYESFVTTDDHLMHLTGIAKDQNGTKYYITKNSWGTDRNDFGGYLNMSESYVRAKTIYVLVHKDALSKDMKKKLGLTD